MLSTLLSFLVLVLGLMLFHKWNPFLGSVVCSIFAFYGVKKLLRTKLDTIIGKFRELGSARCRLPSDVFIFDLSNNVVQLLCSVVGRRSELGGVDAELSDSCLVQSARNRGSDVSQCSPADFMNAEVKTFVDNIKTRYVDSWYRDVSGDQEFPRELEYIIEDVLRALYDRLAVADPCELLQRVIPVAHAHFRKCKEYLATKRGQGDGGGDGHRSRSAPRLKRHLEFSHSALGDEASERCYLKSVMTLLVRLLEPPHLLSSPATNTLVIDILASNILVPIVDLLCDPEWLNWAVLYLCSLEDDVEILAMAADFSTEQSQDGAQAASTSTSNLLQENTSTNTEPHDRLVANIPEGGGNSDPTSSNAAWERLVVSGDSESIPLSQTFAPKKGSECLKLPDVYFSTQDDSASIYGGNDIEEAMEAEEFLGSLVFLDIRISRTESRSVPGKGVHTVYCIEYDTCKRKEDSTVSVSEVHTTWRRFKEFLELQGSLEKNSALEKHLKGIRGPSRWLGSVLSDKKNVQERRIFLQQYLKGLCTREAIVNSQEFHRFLDFQEDGEERQPPEGMKSVPSSGRLDRVFAQGVKNTLELIKTALPGDDHGALSPASPSESNLVLFTDYLPNDIECSFWENEMSQVLQQGMFNFLDNFDQASSPEFSPPLTPSCLHTTRDASPTSASRRSSEDVDTLLLLAKNSEPFVPGKERHEQHLRRLAESLHSEIPFCAAIIDFVVDSLDESHFGRSAHFVFFFEILLGKVLEKILRDRVHAVFDCSNCTVYLHRLHEQLWGQASQEPSFTEAQVARGLVKTIPAFLQLIFGRETVCEVSKLLAKSIQMRAINKCLVFQLMDVLVDFLVSPDECDTDLESEG
ncbi:unnamed protein product [Ixodes persulcatus]